MRVLYAGEEYRLLYDNSTQFLQVSYEDREGEGGGGLYRELVLRIRKLN